MPGHFVEHVYHLEKYACGKCRGGVTTAKGPTPVLERSCADASLLAHVVVSKYVDHVPLHQLHRIYARSGARVAVSTMSDWVGGVAKLVEPLVEELEKRVRKSELVRTDATGVKVLDPDSPENIERGTMWCYVGDERDVVFRYTPTGEGATGPSGSFWRVVRDTCRPTPRASSTACSTVRWPPRPRSDAGRMPGDAWSRSKIWTAAWPTRSS